jgi:DNA-directed RNA polymerase specialized sigma24 family protein
MDVVTRSDGESEHLTRAEMESALRGLSDAEVLRLMKFSARLSDGTSQTGNDLYQEAVLKSLDGERQCPRDVEVSVFLANAIRSLAWAAREREQADPLTNAQDLADPEGPASQLEGRDVSPEEQLAARRGLKAMQQALLDLFDDDEDALKVLLGIFDEQSAEEIRQTWGMDERELATIRRRMRRKTDKAFPGGWQK